MPLFSKKEYSQNVKSFCLEEPFDYILFRPLAYFVVKLTYALPLHPNHFSLLALTVSIISGYFLASTHPYSFLFGGVGLLLFCIFDCCDGMIARMKGKKSKYGELIDMFVDVLSTIFFYGGLFIGLSNKNYDLPMNYLFLVSIFFILLDTSIYNYFKKQFFFYFNNNPNGRKKEEDYYKRELSQMKGSVYQLPNVILIKLYLAFSRLQMKTENIVKFNVDQYVNYNRRILPLWAVVSGSSHLIILAIALIFNKIELYLFYALVFSNLWLIFVGLIQKSVNEKIRQVA